MSTTQLLRCIRCIQCQSIHLEQMPSSSLRCHSPLEHVRHRNARSYSARQSLGDGLVREEGVLGAAYRKRTAATVGSSDGYKYRQTNRSTFRRKKRVKKRMPQATTKTKYRDKTCQTIKKRLSLWGEDLGISSMSTALYLEMIFLRSYLVMLIEVRLVLPSPLDP